MRARSALFDLYGDYLRDRGGRAPVAALVRLLAPLGIAAPAVRTAISRMVAQGWLAPYRPAGDLDPFPPGYQLTARAVHRLDEAGARIYRTGEPPWSGEFDLLVLAPPTDRGTRVRLAATLAYLGYGRLDATTWVAPRPAPDVVEALTELAVPFERFAARHAGGPGGAAALVRRAWDLGALATAYERFVTDQSAALRAATPGRPADEAAYALRFRLVHAWRSFLFHDPHLPAALLPRPWAGAAAAEFFTRHAARLRPAADRFVDGCLGLGHDPDRRRDAA
jgi:phenylacetic acid degradation operon negative regulatory protein